MKNTNASSNPLYVDRPLNSVRAASLFQIARAETEPAPRNAWETIAQTAFGMCAAAALWVGVSATLDLQRNQGAERFVAAALQTGDCAVALAKNPVPATAPAPAPSYL